MAQVTDAAAKLAAEHGIDLEAVTGSGKDGQITQADILKLVNVEEDFGIPADRPVPEELETSPAPWKRAYAYAARYSKFNGVKACVIFADTRMHDQEFQDAAS